DFGTAGFGLDVKAPQHKAGNLPTTKTIPQNINRRERRQRGQREHGERIGEEGDHLTYPLAMLALATLPALAAIYILRNRFRRRQVSSLVLWRFHVQSKSGGAKV